MASAKNGTQPSYANSDLANESRANGSRRSVGPAFVRGRRWRVLLQSPPGERRCAFCAERQSVLPRQFVHSFELHRAVGGSNAIPLTYVDNCAEAIVLGGLKAGVDGETFNVLDDELLTGKQFLKEFKKRVKPFHSVSIPYSLA